MPPSAACSASMLCGTVRVSRVSSDILGWLPSVQIPAESIGRVRSGLGRGRGPIRAPGIASGAGVCAQQRSQIGAHLGAPLMEFGEDVGPLLGVGEALAAETARHDVTVPGHVALILLHLWRM